MAWGRRRSPLRVQAMLAASILAGVLTVPVAKAGIVHYKARHPERFTRTVGLTREEFDDAWIAFRRAELKAQMIPPDSHRDAPEEALVGAREA